MTSTETDLQTLLGLLTHDNWFDMLPLLHDAYYDARGTKAADAVAYLVREGKKPHMTGDGFLSWWYHLENIHNPRREHSVIGQLCTSVDLIIARMEGLSGESLTYCKSPRIMLEAFVEAWENRE